MAKQSGKIFAFLPFCILDPNITYGQQPYTQLVIIIAFMLSSSHAPTRSCQPHGFHRRQERDHSATNFQQSWNQNDPRAADKIYDSITSCCNSDRAERGLHVAHARGFLRSSDREAGLDSAQQDHSAGHVRVR
jgi:hypothetical protein